MVDGGVAGRDYPVSLANSIPAAPPSGMAALSGVANSPVQMEAPAGTPLAGVRQFGDARSPQAPQIGAEIPAAAPGSSLGPADQFSWRVMPTTDATQQAASLQSAPRTMAASSPAQTPLLTMAEKDRAAGHNPNGPYRYDQMGNKQWIGETRQTQVANANQFAESIGQPAKTVSFTDPLTGESLASSRRTRRPAFADGGAVKETPEQMLARMSSKYGLGGSGQQQAPQPAPVPAPAPTPQQPTQGGLMGKTTDAIGRRNDELRQVSRYADGGMVDRVKDAARGAARSVGELLNIGKPNETVVRQPVTRYDDSQIVVSRGEERSDMPQERKQSFMAETTRRGQQMREAMNYGDGGMVRFAGKGGPRDDKIPVKVAGESINVSDGENAVILPAKTAANPQAVGLIGQIIQATNDGRAPNMGISDGGKYQRGSYPYTDEPVPTAQQVYAPVAQGLATQAFPSTAKVVQEYGDKAQKAAEQGNYGGALGHVARGGVEGVYGVADDVMRSAAYVLDPAANALKTFVTGDSTPINRPSAAAPAVPQGMAQAALGNEGRGASALQSAISPAASALRAGTGNAGDATVTPSDNLRFTQPGFDPTQQRFANGTGAMTSAKTGKTMVVTPGSYTAADGSETDDWSKTQAYADAIRRNQADKVRLAEMQAQRLGGNPQDILMKSQGMAQAAADSSLNQQSKQQAIDAGQVSLEQAQQLQAIGRLMTEGKTPEVRAEAARAYHAMTGKGRDTPQEQYDNIVVKDYDQNGMVIGERIEQRPKNRAVAATPSATTKVITKEMQERLAPALAAQGLTLQQYASQHGLTIGK
jgi:hypothetical protein